MKLSDAMERGMQGRKQAIGVMFRDLEGCAIPHNYLDEYIEQLGYCCAMGAAVLGGFCKAKEIHKHPAWEYVARLNDHNKMTIPEIIEVLRGMNL